MKQEVQRMCFVCRNTFDKKNLNRIVKNKNEEIFLDKTGKACGRGAYICNSPDCMAKLKNPKMFYRAFKCNLSQDVYSKICEDLIDRTN